MSKKQSLADAIGRTPDMPEIANHIYSKEPDEKDIEWAKQKINTHTDVEALEKSLIKSIHVNDSNFKHIASTGIINGTLKIELHRILKEMHTAALSKNEGWVRVEDVVDLIRTYPHMSLSSTHDLIKKINALPEAPKK